MADLQGRKVFKVFNQDFIVDERYNVTKELGQGAYGIVWWVELFCPSPFSHSPPCPIPQYHPGHASVNSGNMSSADDDQYICIRIYSAATNNQTGQGVAIKKVTNVFSKKILAKRALREIKLLQHFRGHRNVRISNPCPSSRVVGRSDLPLWSLLG
jgi:mitogen-activated protein kinase 7